MSKVDNKHLLKQAHTGNLHAIMAHHREHPDIHWKHIRYEATGDTILHVASRIGTVDMVKYLLETYQPTCVDCRNNDNKTSLHEAAQFSHPEIVKFLLDKGADVNALKKADWTPLMLACTKDCVETVRVLLDCGATVDCCNKDGWTALHLNARQGNVVILYLLLEKAVDLKQVTKNGRSLLHISILHGNVAFFKILVDKGWDINARDRCGNTPLHEVVLSCNLGNFEELVKLGADVNSRNRNGYTILHLAASVGANQIIKLVLEKQLVSVDDCANGGITALHCSARKNLLTTYQLLTSFGASEEVQDEHGRTAKDYLNLN